MGSGSSFSARLVGRANFFDLNVIGCVLLIGGRARFFVDVMGCFLAFGNRAQRRIHGWRRSGSEDPGVTDLPRGKRREMATPTAQKISAWRLAPQQDHPPAAHRRNLAMDEMEHHLLPVRR
jgi:hypothetical protein